MALRVEPKTEAVEHDAPAASGPLAELEAIFDAIDTGRNQTEVFDVPGSNVAIRYQRLDDEQSAAALLGDGEKWERNAQFLIEACDEILYRNPDGHLEPVQAGVKVTFDFRPGESQPIAKILGRDLTAQESVLRLFQGAKRVLLSHAEQVDAWMDRLKAETESEFSGG